jgi:hypothetical protein
MARVLIPVSVLLVACGSGSSGSAAKPVVGSFSASPAMVVGDGGTVTLAWDVSGADRATIDPGVGSVSPVAHGTVAAHVSADTTFLLTASNSGGNTTSSAVVKVCDPAPGNLSGTCNIPSAGQCVDFSGLGSSDQVSLQTLCHSFGGSWVNGPCTTTGRLGTCQVPPLGNGTGIHCSSTGVILERYYPPQYTTASAQDICGTVPGAVFTAG